MHSCGCQSSTFSPTKEKVFLREKNSEQIPCPSFFTVAFYENQNTYCLRHQQRPFSLWTVIKGSKTEDLSFWCHLVLLFRDDTNLSASAQFKRRNTIVHRPLQFWWSCEDLCFRCVLLAGILSSSPDLSHGDSTHCTWLSSWLSLFPHSKTWYQTQLAI